jgi:hypothetical protein
VSAPYGELRAPLPPPIAPEPVLLPRRPPPAAESVVPGPARPVEAEPAWSPIAVLAGEESTEWPAPPMRVGRSLQRRPSGTGVPLVRPAKGPRNPVVGLVCLVLLGLLAAFFAWFSAEPLWLTLGHGVTGTATVSTCSVHGIDKQCADFTANNGSFLAGRVTLLGGDHLVDGPQADGRKITARMVSASGWEAYAGNRNSLYLRWVPGLLLVLGCGLAIAWTTGAFRLVGRRPRLLAILASLGGPVLLAIGMLAASW